MHADWHPQDAAAPASAAQLVAACKQTAPHSHAQRQPHQTAQIGSPQEAAASAGAAQLVAACNAARQFTDIANFTLRCGVCQVRAAFGWLSNTFHNSTLACSDC